MTRRLADTHAVEMGLAALKDSEEAYREMSSRITGHYDEPRTLGKGQALDIMVGEKMQMTRKTAEYVLDTLVAQGEVVVRSGTEFFVLGFSSYGVNSRASRYVLRETFEDQSAKTLKDQRNKLREELWTTAERRVLNYYRNDVAHRYKVLCEERGLNPRKEV